MTVAETIDNYERTKDTKRKKKGNQFLIVSGLSNNHNDNQYTQRQITRRWETMTTVKLFQCIFKKIAPQNLIKY